MVASRDQTAVYSECMAREIYIIHLEKTRTTGIELTYNPY